MVAPSSKSMGHREIICAGLAAGTSIIDNISMSKDIEATMRCLKAINVAVDEIPSMIEGRKALQISGTGHPLAAADSVDCGESGSTLRFFLPLGANLNCPLTFTGHGKLVSRPLQAYYDIFDEKFIQYFNDNGNLPVTVNGRLTPGTYKLPGDVSSQFVSGLLFALPMLNADSVIEITSPLESSAYVDMTINCLAKFGIQIENEGGMHRRYLVKGKQHYQAQDSQVEGDWSQAAFWTVGGSLGTSITCEGVNTGTINTLHPSNAQKLDKNGSAVCIEIDIDDFVTVCGDNITFEEPSTQQSTYYDLSLIMKEGVTFADISDCWNALNLEELGNVKVIDTYEKGDIKSITVRLNFYSKEKTIEMEQVQGWIDTILANLNKIGIELRA